MNSEGPKYILALLNELYRAAKEVSRSMIRVAFGNIKPYSESALL